MSERSSMQTASTLFTQQVVLFGIHKHKRLDDWFTLTLIAQHREWIGVLNAALEARMWGNTATLFFDIAEKVPSLDPHDTEGDLARLAEYLTELGASKTALLLFRLGLTAQNEAESSPNALISQLWEAMDAELASTT